MPLFTTGDLYFNFRSVFKGKTPFRNIINEFYRSRKKQKNNDDYRKDIVNSLKKNYNVNATDLIHLNSKANGKGELVLHKFILENVFEIVLIDPWHQIHSYNLRIFVFKIFMLY